jgi:hypothetical protein
MVFIRGTRKVLDRVGSPSEPDTASTTMLGDGFVTVLFWRPQVALFVNATSLLPVFMPMAPAATVLERFPETLAGILRTHGIADHIIAHEVGQTAEQHLAKTNNRSVVGVMTEFRPPRRLASRHDRRFGGVRWPLRLADPWLSMRASGSGPWR